MLAHNRKNFHLTEALAVSINIVPNISCTKIFFGLFSIGFSIIKKISSSPLVVLKLRIYLMNLARVLTSSCRILMMKSHWLRSLQEILILDLKIGGLKTLLRAKVYDQHSYICIWLSPPDKFSNSYDQYKFLLHWFNFHVKPKSHCIPLCR